MISKLPRTAQDAYAQPVFTSIQNHQKTHISRQNEIKTVCRKSKQRFSLVYRNETAYFKMIHRAITSKFERNSFLARSLNFGISRPTHQTSSFEKLIKKNIMRNNSVLRKP
jgi:cellobiose phosphorylase